MLGRYRATVAGDGQCPLLFLDVDGPLLPFGGSTRPGSEEPAGFPHLARLRLDAGPRLAGLPCTLVWATTWLEDANTEIAPRLGLCWKTRTVVAWAASRPFAWVDDEITEADRDWVSAHHRGHALLRSVDASIGLTDQDLTALDAWLRGRR